MGMRLILAQLWRLRLTRKVCLSSCLRVVELISMIVRPEAGTTLAAVANVDGSVSEST